MKERRLQIRISEDEYNALLNGADAMNVSVASYVLSSTVYAKQNSKQVITRDLVSTLTELKNELIKSNKLFAEILSKAELIAADRKARSSQIIAKTLRDMCQDARNFYVEALVRILETLGDDRPRRA